MGFDSQPHEKARETRAAQPNAAEADAEPVDTPDAGSPTHATTGTPGESCSPDGAKGCGGHDSVDKLFCRDGRWVFEGSCDGETRCDTQDGARTLGTCQAVVSQCIGKSGGAAICDGPTRRRCDADRLRYEAAESCQQNAHCDSTAPLLCTCNDGYRDDGQGGCTDAQTVTITTALTRLRLLRNASATVEFRWSRGDAFADAVSLAVDHLPEGVTVVEELALAADRGTGVLRLNARPDAQQGVAEITLTAKLPARADGSRPPPPRGAALQLIVQDKPGTPDTSFGTNGRLVLTLGRAVQNAGFHNAIVARPDGTILTCGDATRASGASIYVASVRESGQLDERFGMNGVAWANSADSINDAITSLSIDAKGRIYGAGFASPTNDNGAHSVLAVRFTPDGTLDSTFRPDGTPTRVFGTADAKGEVGLLDPDGGFIVGGFAAPGPVLVKFREDGELATDFGAQGISTLTPASELGQINWLARQSDGKLIASAAYGTDAKFSVLRLSKQGTVDESFGVGGQARLDMGPTGSGFSTAVLVQPDDSSIVVGYVKSTATSAFAACPGQDCYVALAKLSKSGELDETFAQSVRHGGYSSGYGWSAGAARQSDGSIVVVGQSDFVPAPALAVWRFNARGEPDTAFGEKGRALFDANGRGTSIGIDDLGRILIAGRITKDNQLFSVVIYRLWP